MRTLSHWPPSTFRNGAGAVSNSFRLAAPAVAKSPNSTEYGPIATSMRSIVSGMKKVKSV